MPHTKYDMRAVVFFSLVLLAVVRCVHCGTLVSLETSVGNMELELYDQDKPVTVSNFVKYVTSGVFTNLFIQRWQPNFVIQAGGFRVIDTTDGLRVSKITPYGNITNEYSVGRTFSNTYGTLAMARQGGVVNSASSQWFLNLTNNSFLDKVDQGFTVFGHITSGTNILNLFIPPPLTTNIDLINLNPSPIQDVGLGTVPVMGNQTNINSLDQLFQSLIYLKIKLRRDLGLTITRTFRGETIVSWNTVAGVTNTLQYQTVAAASGSWTVYTNLLGNGSVHSLIDTSKDTNRIYRVALTY